ncbi:hypothetical protein [Fructilactobacillus fructivorans]|uniref:Uncharacterized protein n=1 Tax=Fructilactobacillus fructivorans TaxID=1614 RepID=A0AAE6TVV9_9LACO|nr:hypothetical protein [Fructilactobacillus fructivorans]KRK58076.1 hypothetical protein FC73_GL000454 [Fructilactobacillus fructivorans]KRN13102.1 hypothetical protein IV37_GL000740 [Fructilactobacillus fructivorans]KRN41305.1 hypothetical protein IV51_GL000625 [Fructilactobacillus fructivorans]KRN42897.1 hypothetical protein IV48_GL001125 [Fructilactobacillus fructivorans]QFX92082.1 hypothetical protein LF543_00125 [Fructilactobacillus fructivorans]
MKNWLDKILKSVHGDSDKKSSDHAENKTNENNETKDTKNNDSQNNQSTNEQQDPNRIKNDKLLGTSNAIDK